MESVVDRLGQFFQPENGIGIGCLVQLLGIDEVLNASLRLAGFISADNAEADPRSSSLVLRIDIVDRDWRSAKAWLSLQIRRRG